MRASILRSAVVVAAVLGVSVGAAPTLQAETADAIGRLIAEELAKPAGHGLPSGAARVVVPAERPSDADEQRILEEIDMLERARAEAEARRDALVKERELAESAAGAGPEAARKAETARKAAEEAERDVAAARRAAEEQHRIAEEHRRNEEARRAAAEASRKAEDERRLAEEQARAASELAHMEAEREAEAERIDEALRKAREQREKRAGIERGPYVSDAPDLGRRRLETDDASPDRTPRDAPSASGTPAWPPASLQEPRASSATRVTVLISMVPGNRGIRRHNKTGDPILCGERGCYISTGADHAADLLPLRRAFGASQTLGERAGACRNSLGCVFRNVDVVAYPAILQPVDMRFLRHDRRQPQVLYETSACRIEGGRLACTSVQGPDYTMWIVPEEIADAAGPAVLERAVEAGLPALDAPLVRPVRH